MKNEYIFWPDKNERDSIVKHKYYELPFCIGYVDGTEIKLAEAPVLDPESYFSRKKIYSVKLQVGAGSSYLVYFTNLLISDCV